MSHLRRGPLPIWLAASAALLAAAATHADPVARLQMLRAGGCGGIAPAAPAVQADASLNRVARLWAAGRTLGQAMYDSGFAAEHLSGMRFSGSDDAMVRELRRSSCQGVMDLKLRAVGVFQRGTDTWLVLASSASPSAAPSPAPTPRAVQPLPATASPPLRTAAPVQANRALQLVNDVRARGTYCGARRFAPAPPLILSGTLDGVASGHASDMAVHNYFEHQDLAGHSPADRVRAVGYAEKLVGENIAYGPESIEEAVQGWLHSPEHCENIMDPRFVEMGIAAASGHDSRHGLYWVQVLAEPRA